MTGPILRRLRTPRFLFCGLAIALLFSACAGGAPRADERGQRQAARVLAVPEYRTIAETVEDENLILDSERAAREYLKKKLVGLLAQDLMALGFDAGDAARMAAGAQAEGWVVRGHREKVAGKGDQAGKILDMVLYDVKGKLSAGLREADMDRLLTRLQSLPVTSMEEIEAVEGFLAAVDALRPDAARMAGIRRRVGDAWAGQLGPFMQAQLDIPLEPPEDYIQALGRIALVLRNFRKLHPAHPGFADLEKRFTLAALRALKTIPVKAEGFQRINSLLARVAQMTGGEMPDVIPYLKRNLELAWRDYLVALDDRGAPFSEARREFVYFLELFPKSKFYPDLELRFLTRWYEHLLAHRPSDLDGLVDFIRETQLMAERFPSFGQVAEVQKVLGQRCVQVLAKVEADKLEDMTRIRSAVLGCDPFMPSGAATMDMRARLDRIEQKLLDARDDRLERQALAELTFFIEWDQAVQSLPWGRAAKDWTGGGAFEDKWKHGQEAGQDCRCTLDPDAPCREFDSTGPAGGFEVVARFHQKKLFGLDLCQVYAGDKLNTIYRFFARRYKAMHDNDAAAHFLASAGGVGDVRKLRFEKAGQLQVILERSADTCTIRYRSVPLLAQVEKEEQERLAREERERIAARKARVARGWQAGDCVRWKCRPACKLTGRVKSQKKDRYLVTITGNPDNPRREGSDVWVDKAGLFDCKR